MIKNRRYDTIVELALLFYLMCSSVNFKQNFKEKTVECCRISLNWKNLPYYPDPISYTTLLIGYSEVQNEGVIKNCIKALEQTAPGAKLVIITNYYTDVDASLINDCNLWVSIEYTSINLTRDDVNKLYPYKDNFWTWFGVHRYQIYVDYLEMHQEYEYILFMDADTLILKNPMQLLYRENTNYIHMMNDYWPYRRTSDFNFIWFRDYYKFMESSDRCKKCGIKKLPYNLRSPDFIKNYPINAGLMFGKTKEVLKLCRLLGKAGECIGMFPGGCEQSLINYMYYNGMINNTGVVIRTHHMKEGEIISCPEWCSTNTLHMSDQWFVVHHYKEIRNKFELSDRIKKIIL